MHSDFRRLARLIGGWALLLLGVVGLFLPIVQGFLFLLAGLFILSREHPWAHNVLERLRKRFPTVEREVLAATRRAKLWWWRWIFRTGSRPAERRARTLACCPEPICQSSAENKIDSGKLTRLHRL